MATQSAPKIVGPASDEIAKIIEGIGGLNVGSRVLRSALDDGSSTEPLPDSLAALTKSASAMSADADDADLIPPFWLA